MFFLDHSIDVGERLDPPFQDDHIIVNHLLWREVAAEEGPKKLFGWCVKSLSQQLRIALLEGRRVLIDHIEHCGGKHARV
jgi:hypothetical protein